MHLVIGGVADGDQDGDQHGLLDRLLDEHAVPSGSRAGSLSGVVGAEAGPTVLLTHAVRDRASGDRLPIEVVVQRLTSAVADRCGLADRGVVAPGYRADLNVIDHDALRVTGPTWVEDPPGSGLTRPVYGAEGYRATIVAGIVTAEDGRLTGERPGRLVRGPQPPPAG